MTEQDYIDTIDKLKTLNEDLHKRCDQKLIELDEAEKKFDELNYISGQYKCPKCELIHHCSPHISNHQCHNGCGIVWRITWNDYVDNLNKKILDAEKETMEALSNTNKLFMALDNALTFGNYANKFQEIPQNSVSLALANQTYKEYSDLEAKIPVKPIPIGVNDEIGE